MNDRIHPANIEGAGVAHSCSAPVTLRLLLRRSDADGRARDVNDAWLEHTGRDRERTLGDGWLDDVHPDDRARCAAIQQAMSDARKPYALDYRLRHGEGGHRWVMERAEPQCRDDGLFDGYLHRSVDVDERTCEANELAARAHSLRQALHRQLGFAAALARDLPSLPPQDAAVALATMVRLGRGSSALALCRWSLERWVRSAVDTAASIERRCPPVSVEVPAGSSIDINLPLLEAVLASVLGDAARHAPQAFEHGIRGKCDGAEVWLDLPGRDGGSPCALLACAIELHGGNVTTLPGGTRIRLTLPLAGGG